MMKEIFYLGLLMGMFLLTYITLIIDSLISGLKINKYKKYLIETKQIQKYEEWKKYN